MIKFLLILFFLISSCVKPKTVLICGDHECINKKEAKQYFEDNLTLEVKVISKKKEVSYDLVDLNINNNQKNIQINKKKTSKIVKKLSKEQIKIKKKEIRERSKKNNDKKEKVIVKKKEIRERTKKNNDIKEKVIIKKKEIVKLKTKKQHNLNDICLKLEKCDIDNIASYLIKISNEKDYPNISLRE